MSIRRPASLCTQINVRSSAAGEAISLVCAEERGQLKDIARLIGREIPAFAIAGFEPVRGQPVPANRGTAPKAAPRSAAPKHRPFNGHRRHFQNQPQKSAEHRAGKSRRVH